MTATSICRCKLSYFIRLLLILIKDICSNFSYPETFVLNAFSFPSDSETPSDDNMLEYPYPNTNALFYGGLSRFFQGEPRSNSPFFIPEEQDMTISKTAVFNALREGGKRLSLRVMRLHFFFIDYSIKEKFQ